MKNRLYDATKIDWDNLMFSTKELWMLLIPIMVEQMLNSLMGMADTMMVSNVGSVAMSAVSLVDSINTLVIQVFAALATGAAIICSHYLGKGDERGANKAARQIFLTVIVISLTITAGGLIFCRPLLRLIFGAVEPAVMEDSIIYFLITASSYPFIALFNAGGAFYRAGGNSKFPMQISIISNVLNIIGNAVFVFGFDMGVAGVALSTLISRAFASVVILVLLHQEKYEIHCTKWFLVEWDKEMLKKIFSIGVPQALENSMFQIGKLLTQSMIAGFGTASIAANVCAMTVEQLAFMPGSAMGLAMTTVVGQCVGAGDYKQARSYTKKLITGAYAFLWILNILLLAAAPLFAGAYNLSDGAYWMAVIVIRYHSICCMMIWPLAFTLPNTMRSAGDAKFTMTVSILSMWFVRIALAYLIGVSLHVGLLGVWIAQTLDWVVRAGFYIVRYLGYKWENKSVVRQQEKEILAE